MIRPPLLRFLLCLLLLIGGAGVSLGQVPIGSRHRGYVAVGYDFNIVWDACPSFTRFRCESDPTNPLKVIEVCDEDSLNWQSVIDSYLADPSGRYACAFPSPSPSPSPSSTPTPTVSPSPTTATLTPSPTPCAGVLPPDEWWFEFSSYPIEGPNGCTRVDFWVRIKWEWNAECQAAPKSYETRQVVMDCDDEPTPPEETPTPTPSATPSPTVTPSPTPCPPGPSGRWELIDVRPNDEVMCYFEWIWMRAVVNPADCSVTYEPDSNHNSVTEGPCLAEPPEPDYQPTPTPTPTPVGTPTATTSATPTGGGGTGTITPTGITSATPTGGGGTATITPTGTTAATPTGGGGTATITPTGTIVVDGTPTPGGTGTPSATATPSPTADCWRVLSVWNSARTTEIELFRVNDCTGERCVNGLVIRAPDMVGWRWGDDISQWAIDWAAERCDSNEELFGAPAHIWCRLWECEPQLTPTPTPSSTRTPTATPTATPDGYSTPTPWHGTPTPRATPTIQPTATGGLIDLPHLTIGDVCEVTLPTGHHAGYCDPDTGECMILDPKVYGQSWWIPASRKFALHPNPSGDDFPTPPLFFVGSGEWCSPSTKPKAAAFLVDSAKTALEEELGPIKDGIAGLKGAEPFPIVLEAGGVRFDPVEKLGETELFESEIVALMWKLLLLAAVAKGAFWGFRLVAGGGE